MSNTARDVEHAYDAFERARFLLIAVAVLMLIGTSAALITIALQNRANGELLIECSTPPDERNPPVLNPSPNDCYLRVAARDAQAARDRRLVGAVAAACGAANPGDIPATRRCVEDALARADGGE